MAKVRSITLKYFFLRQGRVFFFSFLKGLIFQDIRGHEIKFEDIQGSRTNFIFQDIPGFPGCIRTLIHKRVFQHPLSLLSIAEVRGEMNLNNIH